jgi:glycosyltransferase involved in cell wall biosynthesis
VREQASRPGTPEVSVVVPVRDAATTLPRCLGALAAQTLADDRYEVIVVDNGSRDESVEIARRAPHAHVLEEPRPGAYAARNRALGAARGGVLAFTDPDCAPDPDWLEAALAALADGAVVAVGRTLPARPTRLLRLLALYSAVKDEYSFASADPDLYYGRTNNMAVARSVFDDVGSFVEHRRGADTLLVRAVVDRYGTDLVRFEPRLRVRHAELTGLLAHLRKLHVYGYVSRSTLGAPSIPRPLTTAEWTRLLRETARRSGGVAALPVLVALTAATRASSRLGSLRAAAGLPPPRGL